MTEPCRCAWCGRKQGRWLEHLTIAGDEDYRGNLQVVRRKRYTRDLGHGVEERVELLLWDGESYWPFRYGGGLFDRLSCAEAFATAAHAAGYRRVNR